MAKSFVGSVICGITGPCPASGVRWYHKGRSPGQHFATRREGKRMSDMPRPTADELTRQARQHLESLRAAGVEWLPNAPLQVAVPPSPPPGASATPTPSLFAEAAAAAAPVLPVEQR